VFPDESEVTEGDQGLAICQAGLAKPGCHWRLKTTVVTSSGLALRQLQKQDTMLYVLWFAS
jgi:hypothetical protein